MTKTITTFILGGVAALMLAGMAAISVTYLVQTKTFRVKLPEIVVQEKLPEMPVSVGFRKAWIGSGHVLVIENKSGKSLRLNVTVKDAALRIIKAWSVIADGA